jgi:hypothetical protein
MEIIAAVASSWVAGVVLVRWWIAKNQNQFYVSSI